MKKMKKMKKIFQKKVVWYNLNCNTMGFIN